VAFEELTGHALGRPRSWVTCTAANAKGSAVEMGRGVIDIPGVMRTLVKIGYTGIVSFEYEKDADDPVPGLAESVGYARGVLATI